MSEKIYWPESQECIGCKHGCFLANDPESSTYICSKGLDSPEEDCHEPDVSNIKELELDDLQVMEDIFYDRQSKGLPIDLEDFRVLEEELEGRCNI